MYTIFLFVYTMQHGMPKSLIVFGISQTMELGGINFGMFGGVAPPMKNLKKKNNFIYLTLCTCRYLKF